MSDEGPSQSSGRDDSGRVAVRTAWIGAGATVVAAVIGAVAAIMASASGSGGGGPVAGTSSATAVAASAARSGEAAPQPSPSATWPASPSPSASSSAAWSLWYSGPLVLGENGADGEKDLDARPPARSETEGDNDVYVDSTLDPELDAYGDTTIARWTGGGKLPGYADCAGIVGAAGASQQTLKVGDVFCVRTVDGRVARLKARKLDTDTGYLNATFDAEIWEPAG